VAGAAGFGHALGRRFGNAFTGFNEHSAEPATIEA